MNAPLYVPEYDLISRLVSDEIEVLGPVVLGNSAFGKLHICYNENDFQVELPPVTGNRGKIIGIRINPYMSHMVGVKASGAELIDGQNVRLMWKGESAFLLCDGTFWSKVCGNSLPLCAAAQRTSVAYVLPATQTIIRCTNLIHESVAGMVSGSGVIYFKRPGTFLLSGGVYLEANSVATQGECYTFLHISSETSPPINPAMLASSVSVSISASNVSYAHSSASFSRKIASATDYVALASFQNTNIVMGTRTVDIVTPHLEISEIPSW